jgi:hypothetical protein
MPFPSRIQGSGQSGGSAQFIAGTVATAKTATGSTAADALALSDSWNVVSTAASGTGVKLPTAEAGAQMLVANDGASTLTVYPQTGSTIDGAASVTIATTKRRFFVGTSPTTWVSLLGA